MSNLTDEYLKENVCTDCDEHWCAKGYTVCEGCINDFPEELDDEDKARIIKLRKLGQ